MSRRLSRRSFLKLASSTALLSLLSPTRDLLLKERPVARPVSAVEERIPASPNIIILVFDTLSARHMSLYGYPRRTTPNLERFAENATVFHHHYASGNFTSPGTASILTGVYPWQHRAFQHGSLVNKLFSQRSIFHLIGKNYFRLGWGQTAWVDLLLCQYTDALDSHLDPAANSLFFDTFWNRKLFQRDSLLVFQSYERMLFDKDGSPASLFSSAVDRIHVFLSELKIRKRLKDYPRGIPNLIKYNLFFRLEDVVNGIIQILRNTPSPSISYLHFYSPHEPYTPRSEFIGVFKDHLIPSAKPEHFFSLGFNDQMLTLARLWYDEYIAHVDSEFGRMWDTLSHQRIFENSFVIITSDHGQLFERGVHGHDTPLLYESVVHVPLLIHQPGQTQRQDVFSPTSAVDLVPTLLQAIGRPVPDWCDGVPLLSNRGAADRPIYVIEAKTNSSFKALKTGTFVLIRYPYKLIAYLGYPGYHEQYELYNLADDPEELNDLSSSQVGLFQELKSELHTRLDEVNEPYLIKG